MRRPSLVLVVVWSLWGSIGVVVRSTPIAAIEPEAVGLAG